MPNFLNLPPFTEDGDVHVVVETPRGSRAKFAYDPKLETFILSKSLLTGLTRSEERRVGKECRFRWPPLQSKKKNGTDEMCTTVQICGLPMCYRQASDLSR